MAASRPGQWLLPTLFFLLVAILFPFALGPERRLLAMVAPGVAWVATLLASLIPVGQLYAADHQDGTLDQLQVRGVAMETLALARAMALWVLLGVPVLLALPVLALLFGLPFDRLPGLALAILIGAGGLSALANVAGALTVGARGGAGLVALAVLPLAIPILIFGSRPGEAGALGLLSASALLLFAVQPFATGAALRLAR